MSTAPSLPRMQCGACTAIAFSLYTTDETARIYVECDRCKATSTIESRPAELLVAASGGSAGRIQVP